MVKDSINTKPWLENYPKGVPEEINPEVFENLVLLFDEAFKRNKNLTAYKCMGKELKFGEWDKISKKIAGFFQSLNLSKNAKIAVRNVRRDGMDKLKKMEKDGNLSQDDKRLYDEEIQSLTDRSVVQIDELFSKKEEEIMQV